MKNLKLYLAAVAVCAVAIPVYAQTPTTSTPTTPVSSDSVPSLTDAQIDALIQSGNKSDGKWIVHTPGIHLYDKWAMVGAMTDKTGTLNSGMSADIYTPEAWIEYQAMLCHQKMMPFTLKDVTPDMRRDVLRVVARPAVPTSITPGGMAYAESVAHVVLRDDKKSGALQPLSESQVTQSVQSAVSYPVNIHGQDAEFSMAEVTTARGPDGKGEFFVTLIGEGNMPNKDFKVKSKDFKNLIGQ